MNCKNCGREVDESMRFCPECGETINGEIFNQNIDEDDFILEEEIYLRPKNHVSCLLNEGEYYLDSINGCWDENDGVLFLTTQRLFFTSLDEEFLWGCYLDDVIDNKLEMDGNSRVLKVQNKKGLFSFIIALSSNERCGCFKELLEKSIKGDIKETDLAMHNSIYEKEVTVNRIEYKDEQSPSDIDNDLDYKNNSSPVTYIIIGMIITAFLCVVIYVLNNNSEEENRWETSQSKEYEGHTQMEALGAATQYCEQDSEFLGMNLSGHNPTPVYYRANDLYYIFRVYYTDNSGTVLPTGIALKVSKTDLEVESISETQME